jgi:hypothetical protein
VDFFWCIFVGSMRVHYSKSTKVIPHSSATSR